MGSRAVFRSCFQPYPWKVLNHEMVGLFYYGFWATPLPALGVQVIQQVVRA